MKLSDIRTEPLWRPSFFRFFLLSLTVIFIHPPIHSQNQLVDSVLQATEVDSIYNVSRNQKDDTGKVNLLNSFSERLRMLNQYDSSASFAGKSLNLATKLGFKKGIAASLKNLAIICSFHGDYQKAKDYLFKALAINQKIGNKYGIVRDMNSIGFIYFRQGVYDKALEYNFKAIEITKETKDSDARGTSLSTIGDIYFNQGNYAKALDFEFQSLAIKKGLGDKKGISRNYYLIGNIYQSQSENDKALEYYQKALTINNELDIKFAIAINLSSIGEIYRAEGKLDEALNFFNNSLSINRKIGAQNGIAVNLDKIGNIYSLMGDNVKNGGKEKDDLYLKALSFYSISLGMLENMGNNAEIADNLCDKAYIYSKQKKYQMAKELVDSSLKLSMGMADKEGLRNSYRLLANLDSAVGEYRVGWNDYKNFILYRDSLVSELNTKKALQAEMNYHFEQTQEKEKAEQDKKDFQAGLDRKKQTLILNFFIVGFVLVLALAFFIFRGYRHKQKANLIITKQKEEVERQKVLVEGQKEAIEEKQKEILDSIHYAQRIQNTLLASDVLLQKHLKEHFILFKPKDIVSGDFYWATSKENRFYLAVCDSTGHGVPGAFMSILNMSFLNEAINEKNIDLPNEIFNHTRKRLIEHISQNGGQDGMDGILLEINYDPLSIRYSAAINLPLLVRDNQVIELNTDKMPVGTSPRDGESFKPYTFELQENDLIYAFTDGFSDQFGGPKGKKYRYRELCEKLLAICHKPLKEQQQLLENEFNKWKGNLEQVDDVLIIGMKV